MKRKDLYSNEDVFNPKASNKTGAYGTFYFRDVYDSFIYKDAQKDLWYIDHFFGRVNDDKEAVIVSERNLKQLSNTKKTVFAIPPVAAAWSDLLKYIEKAKFRGDMQPEGSYYANPEPIKGWESPHKMFAKYNSTMYDMFSGSFMTSARDRSIKDFDGFVKVFLEFVEIGTRVAPWTREGYLLSKRSTPHFSGMCIEIAKKKHDKDEEKAKFLADKNFEFFKRAAKRFGFDIDRNAPWRLIPDLDSRGMRKYMKRTGSSRASIYDDFYIKTYDWELQNFKHYLWGWYNNYVNANPVVQIVVPSNSNTELGLTVRQSYKEEELFEKYSDHYFIKLYAYVRALEAGKDWSQSTFDTVVYKARDFLRIKGLSTAMKYLHNNIKPCDGKKTREVFDRKGLTEEQIGVILEKNKKDKSFSYY